MTKPFVAAEACTSLGAPSRSLESFPNKDVSLGALHVTRALPIREKRMIGPWCFLDRFGPLTFADDTPMNVAPHPHTGLQTVTWLFDGEVLHDDSLGSESTARPGGVNVMTAGRGIAHAEQTPRANSGQLNGAQLWVALPDASRQQAPSFAAIDRVPIAEQNAGIVKVFAGELAGARSIAPHFSDLVGAEVQVHANHDLEVGVDSAFEHSILLIDGDCAIDGEDIEPRRLYYLGTQRSSVCFRSRAGGRVLFLGGPPFPETILMWWNFVARTPEEIAEARADWEAGRRFGEVSAYNGPRLPAPELARIARANPMS
jgi:redox-sensitive bicupin YhaK (pirin superfamily)